MPFKKHPSSTLRPQRNGFTLIELLAALVVSSVLLVSMIGAMRFSETRAEMANIGHRALQVAVTQMDDAESSAFVLATISGQDGDIVWRRNVRTLKSIDVGRVELYQVVIFAGRRGRPALVRLEKLILRKALP